MTETKNLPATVHTFADLERMAKAIAASKLFGVQTPDAALSLMLLAQAEGRHPAIAARDYHIIEGRPSLKADTMLARFLESGGRVEWHELTDQRAEATFTHPTGGRVRLSWTYQDAERAKLPKIGDRGPNAWHKYPRAMLRSRLISEGIRTVAPGVIAGVYTPEELADGDVELRHVPPDVAPVAPQPERTTTVVGGVTVDTGTGEVVDAEIVSESKGAPRRLDPSRLEDFLIAIREADDLDALGRVFRDAYKAAKELDDRAALKALTDAKDKRKAALAAPAPEAPK